MATTTRTKSIKHEARTTRVVRDAAAETTNKILAALKAGTVPWQKTWESNGSSNLPTSLSTGRPYRGVNVFTLWLTGAAAGYASNLWGTYKQISERGGQVRKGEKSTEIVFWKILEKTDSEGKAKKIPLLRLFHVFNIAQADWADDAKLPQVAEPVEGEATDPIAAAEELVAEYLAKGPSLGHGGGSAFYRPAADHVQMPQLVDFVSAEAYHSTLFHELTHSTGHDSRLKREGIAQGTFGSFGDKVYSNEELIAEMGAAILCSVAGIEQAATLDNSASYLAHWIKALEGDSNLIIKAASAAQKAVDRIVGTTFADKEEGAA
jgi:antirestriction protein ArdC